MKAGKYSIRELFNNRYIEQIVVPEIQRDYVWGKEQVTGLLTSIMNDFIDFGKANFELSTSVNQEIADAFREYYKRQMFASNIGFIYAYNDPEYSGKYFLIDGQQRITTIYILLLALANKVETFKSDFRKIYLENGKLKLDYKVREASHDFLKQFVDFVLNGVGKVTDQSWYYKEYDSDATISAIVGNYSVISEILDSTHIPLIDFANYLQDYVDFWYFDTNISEQGEELYIYMNARGEQMQGNENLKADILSNLTIEDVESIGNRVDFTFSRDVDGVKKYWGLKWEEWQDFFWKKRASNENADKGFNEFLFCIAGLENYLNSLQIFYSKNEFEGDKKGKPNSISYSDLQKPLSKNKILRIEKYVNALMYLDEKHEAFEQKYSYSAWVGKCIADLWLIINHRKTNWFADYGDEDRGTEVSRMVFLWSTFYFFSSNRFELDLMSVKESFRVIRLFYVRYKNYNRAIKGIIKGVDDILANGPFKASPYSIEEQLKHNLYLSFSVDTEQLYEQLIWEIEDHPYNLNGLKNINIGHLVDLNNSISIDELAKIKDLFYVLFPVDIRTGNETKVNNKLLQTILLYYGVYWYKSSPNYYQNYCFGEWPRIIRDLDSEENIFSNFFTELLNINELDLRNILDVKSKNVTIDKSTTDLREQLIWYSIQLREILWKQGDYVAVRTDWEGNDVFFPNNKRILNTKGDFKGGNPSELSKLVPESSLLQLENGYQM